MDPSTGRFLSMDPLSRSLLGDPLVHPYVYAANSPIDYGDPSGLFLAPTFDLGGLLPLPSLGSAGVSPMLLDYFIHVPVSPLIVEGPPPTIFSGGLTWSDQIVFIHAADAKSYFAKYGVHLNYSQLERMPGAWEIGGGEEIKDMFFEAFKYYARPWSVPLLFVHDLVGPNQPDTLAGAAITPSICGSGYLRALAVDYAHGPDLFTIQHEFGHTIGGLYHIKIPDKTNLMYQENIIANFLEEEQVRRLRHCARTVPAGLAAAAAGIRRP